MIKRFTHADRLANRRRMQQLGLWRRAEKLPAGQRESYVRGNLQVHLAIIQSRRKP